jgi:hypothetical protein
VLIHIFIPSSSKPLRIAYTKPQPVSRYPFKSQFSLENLLVWATGTPGRNCGYTALNSRRVSPTLECTLTGQVAQVVAPPMPHHVIQRGNRRKPTLFRHEDWGVFCRCKRRGRFVVEGLRWAVPQNCGYTILNDKSNEGFSVAFVPLRWEVTWNPCLFGHFVPRGRKLLAPKETVTP